MAYVIVASEPVNRAAHRKVLGQVLVFYDPTAYDGNGDATWSFDADRALTFPTAAEAFAFWRQVPPNHPRREHDGQPNRPLTAFTISVVPLDDYLTAMHAAQSLSDDHREDSAT